MSEGKLKERILNSHVYERYTTQNGNKRLGILEDELDEILDEAADEFLGFVYDVDQQFVLDWFKKWFGTNLHASMSQVVGGCAGHIDLGKLKDIEKEP